VLILISPVTKSIATIPPVDPETVLPVDVSITSPVDDEGAKTLL
jgi:hypothetical protein